MVEARAKEGFNKLRVIGARMTAPIGTYFFL
jgi:hypothetical protein